MEPEISSYSYFKDELLAQVTMPNGFDLTKDDWLRICLIKLGDGMGKPKTCDISPCDYCIRFKCVQEFYTETCKNFLTESWYREDDESDKSFLQWLPNEVLQDTIQLVEDTSGSITCYEEIHLIRVDRFLQRYEHISVYGTKYGSS